ncbi:MAG: Cobalamin biosynthesis protein CobD [Hyphomicrobiaceae bacterium hypho_1]
MLITEHAAIILLLALALDGFLGEPNWIWSRFPHPVVIMGYLITAIDKNFNCDRNPNWYNRLLGVIALTFWIFTAASFGMIITLIWQFSDFLVLMTVEIILVAILLSARSLYEHVDAVKLAFECTGLNGARKAVSAIVGRNTLMLDDAAVCRAAIESTAENFSDGVVAPTLWYLIAGLPGILTYKIINTADSMIGYRTSRYIFFGWAAARSDDIVNFVPARLAAGLIIFTSIFTDFSGMNALRSAWSDSRKHPSPNAGWPESAMAGAIGLALGGPRIYGKEQIRYQWINYVCRKSANPTDITNALHIMVRATFTMALFVAGFALLRLL